MKKIIVALIILITFLIIYFLQVNFFTWFNLSGVKPNLFILLVFVIGLYAGKTKGISYGIILGILLDLFLGKNIGTSGIMLGIVGLLGGYLDENFSKDSRFTMIIMVILVTIIYEVGSLAFNYIISNVYINIFFFIRILFVESIFNGIITIILYPLIMKLGYKLEKIYKDNKILTRYF